MSLFEQKPEAASVIGSCPHCGSADIFCVWRDAVWEETKYACRKCGKDWIKA